MWCNPGPCLTTPHCGVPPGQLVAGEVGLIIEHAIRHTTSVLQQITALENERVDEAPAGCSMESPELVEAIDPEYMDLALRQALGRDNIQQGELQQGELVSFLGEEFTAKVQRLARPPVCVTPPVGPVCTSP